MTLLIAALVLLLCLCLGNVSRKIGVPTLLAFIGLGMLFGVDGVVKIPFDNYEAAEMICRCALLFIMFYGGFGTSWKVAKATAAPAVLLSSAGVVITALLTAAFCHFVLGQSWQNGLLVGSVISSTDAASVFSILRSRRLNLKNGTASLLEVESGSNDPTASMLTLLSLMLMRGTAGPGQIALLVARQVGFGLAVGFGVAWLCLRFIHRFHVVTEETETMFIVAVAMLSFGLAEALGGNGYLSTYLTGIVLGNARMRHQKTLVHFFDGFTGLMQTAIFFLLGWLCHPSQLPGVALTGLAVALFLTFVARPVAVFALLAPFKAKKNQMLLVSWAGLRGASSIVFAIIATVDKAQTAPELFSLTFFIVLFSMLLQGTLLPKVAKKLDMIDKDGDVMRTFSDYSEEMPLEFLRLRLEEGHPWAGKHVHEVNLPPDVLLALVLRGGKQLVPRGGTMLEKGDEVMLCGPALDPNSSLGRLTEIPISALHDWCGKMLRNIPMEEGQLVLMIRRGDRMLIPDGNTVLQNGDLLVMNQS